MQLDGAVDYATAATGEAEDPDRTITRIREALGFSVPGAVPMVTLASATAKRDDRTLHSLKDHTLPRPKKARPDNAAPAAGLQPTRVEGVPIHGSRADAAQEDGEEEEPRTIALPYSEVVRQGQLAGADSVDDDADGFSDDANRTVPRGLARPSPSPSAPIETPLTMVSDQDDNRTRVVAPAAAVKRSADPPPFVPRHGTTTPVPPVAMQMRTPQPMQQPPMHMHPAHGQMPGQMPGHVSGQVPAHMQPPPLTGRTLAPTMMRPVESAPTSALQRGAIVVCSALVAAGLVLTAVRYAPRAHASQTGMPAFAAAPPPAAPLPPPVAAATPADESPPPPAGAAAATDAATPPPPPTMTAGTRADAPRTKKARPVARPVHREQ